MLKKKIEKEKEMRDIQLNEEKRRRKVEEKEALTSEIEFINRLR
jgi:hypothetical protein